MAPDPDVTSITEDLIITVGGWSPTYARIVMLAVDDDVAVALVDGNGDGAELEMEYWERDDGSWRPGSSSGHGPLGSFSTTRWDAGPMVCAVGPAPPGEVFRVGYEGTVHECQANEFGIWAFIRKVEGMTFNHPLPELLLDEDAETAEARVQMEERMEVVRQKLRARVEEKLGRPPNAAQ